MITLKLEPIELTTTEGRYRAVIDGFAPLEDFKPLRGYLLDGNGDKVTWDHAPHDLWQMMWDFDGSPASSKHFHILNTSTEEFKTLAKQVKLLWPCR